MDISPVDHGLLAFGRFRLDPQRRLLTHDDATVKLTPKAFDLLLHLVRNAGRLVEKDELLTAVWGGRIVEEGNLNQTIFSIRKVLQCEPGSERWIVTAPGRGYRFTAEVQRDSPAPLAATPVVKAGEMSTPLARPARVPNQRLRVMTAAMILVAVAALVWLATRRTGPADTGLKGAAPPPHSVAVLAFDNMSGDPGQDYLSDGLADELINTLSRIDLLRVAARTSSFSFKAKHATISDIARALNVSAVLEGSVLREAGQLRVNVQLINAATGFPFWSRTYDHDLSNVMSSQADIASAVADSLRLTLLGDDRARLAAGGTRNPRALDAYLRGLGYSHTPNNAKAELAAFDSALALDANYAQAHAMRSRALALLVDTGESGSASKASQLEDEALAEAERAVALAPDLGSAHAALGVALEDSRFDFRHAAEEIERGRELAPSDAETSQLYADVQRDLGHTREAIDAADFGVTLDPLSPFRYLGLASALTYAHRYDDALAVMAHAANLEEHSTVYERATIGEIKLMAGQAAEAVASCTGGTSWALQHCLAMAYGRLGRHKEAEAALAQLRSAIGDAGAMQYVTIYAQWGQTDQAIAWLQTAYRLHDTGLGDIKSLPLLDPIRSTVAFKDILRRMDFPP